MVTTSGPELVLLAGPRGWCAGVDRAIAIVEQELGSGADVYLRHAIVHNDRVLAALSARGARTVERVDEIPGGATMVISAHGASPSVRAEAEAEGIRVVDATCPLVSKVHAEVRRYAASGYTIIVIGHRGHVETIGTMGEAPESTVLVTDSADVERLDPPDPAKVAWVCQTTLSVPDAAETVAAIRRRFPLAVGPKTEDICYATTNRQDSVIAVARRSDIVLVLGSPESSNSNRLVERARETGCSAYLISSVADLDVRWLTTARVVGLTAGASTPEELVTQTLAWLKDRYEVRVEEVVLRIEDVEFGLPGRQDQSNER